MVLGNGFEYAFSRGLIAKELNSKGLDYNLGYEIAKQTQKILLNRKNRQITEKELDKLIEDQALSHLNEGISIKNYMIIRRWLRSGTPIIILLSGSPGAGKQPLGKKIATRLGISQVIPSDMIVALLRNLISARLAPELHAESYKASEHLKPKFAVNYDRVIIGYEEHTKYVVEAIESMILRALKEDNSIVIHGEHLAPNLFKKEILSHPFVFHITIHQSDPKIHLKQLLESLDQEQQYETTKEFPQIRKIQEFLKKQAETLELPIFSTQKDSNDLFDPVIEYIIETLEKRLNSSVSPNSS